ncbi:hypothetical protein NCHU2750_09900 [Neorhizobium sp. NCHU2750]|nr:hypothetical protein NCHU2750_09900 [Neorhizobium sp. NCHU2750]
MSQEIGNRNPLDFPQQIADKVRGGYRIVSGDIEEYVQQILICERGVDQLLRFNIRIPRSMIESA